MPQLSTSLDIRRDFGTRAETSNEAGAAAVPPDMRARLGLIALVAVVTPAGAEPLPAIDSVLPPTVRFSPPGYGMTLERVAIDVRSAPAVSLITIEVTGGGSRRRWERGGELPARAPPRPLDPMPIT
jgi:hypothetical protein